MGRALFSFIVCSLAVFLFIHVTNAQKWTDEGPHAIVGDGGMQNIPTSWDSTRPNPGTGAVQAFAALDTTGNAYMIGASGGIWVTRNAKDRAGKVVWKPVTDDLESKYGGLSGGLGVTLFIISKDRNLTNPDFF